MKTDKINVNFILNDYTYVLDRIYNEYQYKDILINTNRSSFIERLINDFNKHKLKKYVIGEEYIFGQPTSKYLNRWFKVIFLGCIYLNKKEWKNMQDYCIMTCGITIFNSETLITTAQEEKLIYYFATKNDYVRLTKSEMKKVIF